MKNKPLVFIIEDAQEMANLIKMYLEKSEIDSKFLTTQKTQARHSNRKFQNYLFLT